MIVDSTVGLITNSSTSIYTEAYNPEGYMSMLEEIARLAGSPVNVRELFEIVVVPNDIYRTYEEFEESENTELFESIFGDVPLNQRGYRDEDVLTKAWIAAYRKGIVTGDDVPVNWLDLRDSSYVVFFMGQQVNLGLNLYNLYRIEASYDG